MKCAACGNEQETGRFCAQCGASLDEARCRACQAALIPGARHCTQCGAAAASGRRPLLPWLLGGAAAVLIFGTLVYPALRSRPDTAAGAAPFTAGAAPFAGGPGATGATPPQLSSSMRENADRLFNRIMETRATGDTAGALQFLPMAISAYQNAESMDNDGLYHLSLLQSLAGDGAGALATAQRILQTEPRHLLALSAAGAGATIAGRPADAKQYYQTMLDVFDEESKRELPEYMDHARVLPQLREEAARVVKR